VAFGEGGQGVSHMGPFVADLDGTGLLDVLVPDMRYGSLYRQVRPGSSWIPARNRAWP